MKSRVEKKDNRYRYNKELWDLVNSLGEQKTGLLHIIDTSSSFINSEEGEYRIYHKEGYCFDLQKEYVCEPENVDEYDGVHSDGFAYTFFNEWEGFSTAGDARFYIELIKKSNLITP